jgi:hypothetical protein
MNPQEIEARYIREFNSPNPAEGLWRLAHALRDEGLPQLDLYFLFEKHFVTTSADDPRYDAIQSALDAIYGGPWAKGSDLYPSPLTDGIIDAERKERGIV